MVACNEKREMVDGEVMDLAGEMALFGNGAICLVYYVNNSLAHEDTWEFICFIQKGQHVSISCLTQRNEVRKIQKSSGYTRSHEEAP